MNKFTFLTPQFYHGFPCQNWRSLLQLSGTIMVYATLLALTIGLMVNGHLWWALLPAIAVGVVLTRLFVIQHDCGHRAYFSQSYANKVTGTLISLLTMAPSITMRERHDMHHNITGNLDDRNKDNVITYTATEFQQLPPTQRRRYRLMRHSAIFFILGPLGFFVLQLRFASAKDSRYGRAEIYTFNTIYLLLLWLLWQKGLLLLVAYYLLAMHVAGTIGLALFYIQHHFDGAYWAHASDWNAELAAMQGSAYLRLPNWAGWLIGWVNFHPIHHLHAGIPNYHLPHVHAYLRNFADYRPHTLTLKQIWRCFRLKVIDDKTLMLTDWRHN